MRKGTAVSDLALYYGKTTPENPGLKKLQHADNSRMQRDQEVATTFDSRNMWRISIMGRP